MVEAVRTSETPVCFYEIKRRYILEDCHFHTRRREKVISHNVMQFTKLPMVAVLGKK
jgi:hypothetical protein